MIDQERSRRKRRLGLKLQLLVLLFLMNLVSAIAYSVVLYRVDRAEIIAGIDSRLLAGVSGVREILPDGFHRRITGPDSISPEEFDRLQERLSRFADNSRFVYVYSYMKFGNEIRTVATSATDEELRTGKQTRFFAYYKTAPKTLYRTFSHPQVTYDEYGDSFGRFRSIYMPVRGQDGRLHVLGADVDLAMLDGRLQKAMDQSIAVGITLFAASMAVGWLFIARMVQPLLRLTSFTRNMEERSFAADEEELAAIRRIGDERGDEVGSLAEAMTAMMARLQRYLVEVREATAARERVEGELTAARDIQVGMLPRVFPPFPDRKDIDVYAMLEPAKHVGGDLYDYFLIDRNRLFFIVGDVSGKGVPAALFMAMTTTLFKAHAMSARPLSEVMERVNTELSRDNAAEMFVTIFAGVLDLTTGEVEYSDGGHEAPFIVRAGGGVERLEKRQGMALGVFEDVPYVTGTFTLAKGDALVLFTDGVSEAEDAQADLFTTSRIRQALEQARAEFSAQQIAEGLAQSVRAFVGPVPQSDDIAILTVCYEGE